MFLMLTTEDDRTIFIRANVVDTLTPHHQGEGCSIHLLSGGDNTINVKESAIQVASAAKASNDKRHDKTFYIVKEY